ncbi:MAG: biopolymer transporter ExbD [Methylotenera sp.]|nr:biopolymer transporter ExbD [Oligoflexia bacterium]
MAFHRSIRSRRGRRKINTVMELQLTSMMDVLVIILVFLLKSYATSNNNFSTVPGLQMPISNSLENPTDSLYVIITPEGVTFENERILDFVQTAAGAGSADATYSFKKTDVDEGGRRIVPLYDALVKAREKAELLRAKSTARDAQGQPLPFEGILAIQADKRVQYDTVRRIMYTAGAAGYKVFRFLAKKQDS